MCLRIQVVQHQLRTHLRTVDFCECNLHSSLCTKIYRPNLLSPAAARENQILLPNHLHRLYLLPNTLEHIVMLCSIMSTRKLTLSAGTPIRSRASRTKLKDTESNALRSSHCTICRGIPRSVESSTELISRIIACDVLRPRRKVCCAVSKSPLLSFPIDHIFDVQRFSSKFHITQAASNYPME